MEWLVVGTAHDPLMTTGGQGFEGFALRDYNVDGQFSSVNGTLFVGGPIIGGPTAIGNLVIWGDGRQLYRSPDMTFDSEPIEFDVDISGVTALRIILEYRNQSNSQFFRLGITGTQLVR